MLNDITPSKFWKRFPMSRRSSRISSSSSTGAKAKWRPDARPSRTQPAERAHAGGTWRWHQLPGGTDEIKLIVLDSAAKAFCGGIELGEYTQRRVFQLLDAFHNAFTAMLDTSKPVLVVVNGPAFGGGAELAALGDW